MKQWITFLVSMALATACGKQGSGTTSNHLASIAAGNSQTSSSNSAQFCESHSNSEALFYSSLSSCTDVWGSGKCLLIVVTDNGISKTCFRKIFQPAFNITPGLVSFGSILPATTSPAANITLFNSGDLATACSVTLSNSVDFKIANTPNCGTLSSNSGCIVSVKATPQTVGLKSTGINVACSGGYSYQSNAQTLTVTGTTTGSLSIAEPSFNFGAVELNSSSTHNFTITNAGGTSLSGCTTTLSAAAGYLVNDANCTNIAAGSSCHLFVTFSPTLNQSYPSNLNMTCGSNSAQIALAGATVPKFTMPPGYFFGTIPINSTGTAQTFNITNTGGSSATGCTLSVSNPTNFLLSPAPNSSCSTLAPGASCSFLVKPKPTGTVATSDIKISCNSGTATGQTSGNALSVNGVNAPALTFSPDTKDFGTVWSSSYGTNQQAVQINNTGSAAALGCTVSISDPSHFTLSPLFYSGSLTNQSFPVGTSTNSYVVQVRSNMSPGIYMTELTVSCSGNQVFKSTLNGYKVKIW